MRLQPVGGFGVFRGGSACGLAFLAWEGGVRAWVKEGKTSSRRRGANFAAITLSCVLLLSGSQRGSKQV